MKIEDIYQQYTEKISQIQLYQRIVKANTKKEYDAIIENEKQFLEKYPNNKDFLSSINNMYFKRADNGNIQIYGQKISDPRQRELNLILHKNKQYQWLLAEAYEEFEDFLESVYAYVGYTNRTLWPMKDFGSITLSEIDNKNFNWFLEQSKNKKNVPKSIISFFANNFERIREIEHSNALKINFKFIITLIEKMRHIIVHKSGVVEDKKLFIDRILRDSGLFNNGKYKQEFKEFIEQFFDSARLGNSISLLEISKYQDGFFDIHRNLFEMLSGHLLAYSYELYKEIKNV